MSVFVEKVCPVSGKKEWVVEDAQYDYHQEIARSAYADMLHDTERNRKYEAALAKAIQVMKSRGKFANVLDIGTGTGLLSMMAVRAGADTVNACDAFEPAVACAKKIIEANGMKDCIRLIHKRSTDLRIPEDMPKRANILVTEVFDTELIGEGAIETFQHALIHLLEEDCIVVPAAANIFIQPVESSFLRNRNHLSFAMPRDFKPVLVPTDVEKYHNCLGAPLYDLQLSQLPKTDFRVLAGPKRAFRFDFCGRERLRNQNISFTDIVIETGGTCHAFFMWWDLEMDMQGETILSCAPFWAHPDLQLDRMQWRDHWMQAVYFPSNDCAFTTGEMCYLRAEHDEYSLTFDISGSPWTLDDNQASHTCSELQCAFTRSRLGALSQFEKLELFATSLRNVINTDTVALCMSESSSLPFILAHLGVKQVITSESNFMTRRVMSSVVERNNLQGKISIFDEVKDIPQHTINEVTLVVGEPYFQMSSLPWHDLHFWYVASIIESTSTVTVVPQSARLMVMPMEFDNLHKIRAPVMTCEGFDLSLYDLMIEDARQRSDAVIEPHPLWEYPGRCLAAPFPALSFDFRIPYTELAPCSIFSQDHVIEADGTWNGVALWMEYQLDEDHFISYGPVGHVKVGDYANWDRDRQQGIHLPARTLPVFEGLSMFHCSGRFYKESGECDFSFDMQTQVCAQSLV